MFYLAWFIFAWGVWFIFADKTRWREIFLVCIFAKVLALATDVLMFYYPLWEYIGSPLLVHLADDLGIYPVVTYLFIQLIPSNRSTKIMLKYWFIWTTIAIAIEIVYVQCGYLRYHQWWSMLHSYSTDWLLYWLFYKFHAIFRLERLSVI